MCALLNFRFTKRNFLYHQTEDVSVNVLTRYIFNRSTLAFDLDVAITVLGEHKKTVSIGIIVKNWLSDIFVLSVSMMEIMTFDGYE